MNMDYKMEHEINSQENIIKSLINDYIINQKINLKIPQNIHKIKIIASGSSYNAGLFGKTFFEKISKIETDVEYASEFSNSISIDNTLFIFISQSGNSFDTVKSFELIKKHTKETLAITNNKESILYKNCTYNFFLNAQKEEAIGATKTFSASVFALWLIALKFAQNKKINIKNELKHLDSLIESIHKTTNNIKKMKNFNLAVDLISKQKNFPLIGSKEKYALSSEASLKIKEINYINTTAYAIGEFIHGHFAILNRTKILLVFLFDTLSELELHSINKILSNYKKIRLIIITNDDSIKAKLKKSLEIYLKEKNKITSKIHNFDEDIVLKIPEKTLKNENKDKTTSQKININSIICAIILCQLLSLYTAIKLNRNVDKPKGLEKVVK